MSDEENKDKIQEESGNKSSDSSEKTQENKSESGVSSDEHNTDKSPDAPNTEKQIVLGHDESVINRKHKAEEKYNKQREKKEKVKGILHYIKQIPVALMWLFGLLYAPIMLLIWLGSLNVFQPSSPFYGFDLIPITYVIYAMLIAAFFAAISKKWIHLGVFLFLFAGFYITSGDHGIGYKDRTLQTSNEQGKKYTAASLNVAQYDKGIETVGKAVTALEPDFIFLNEITWNDKNESNDIGVLSTKLAFPKYNIGTGKISDSAILSKYPIIEFHEIAFSSRQPNYVNNTPENSANNRHRYFLHAVIKDNIQKINLISVRFIAGRSVNFADSPIDCIRYGQFLARTQAKESEEVISYMKKLKGPIIFAGDLNAPPNAVSVQPLYKLGIDAALATGTFPKPTFPADSPKLRLDYIFCTDDFQPWAYSVDDSVISDHRIVFAVLKLIKYDVKFKKYKEDIKAGEQKIKEREAREKKVKK